MFPYLLPMDPNTGETFDETGLFLPTAQDAINALGGGWKGKRWKPRPRTWAQAYPAKAKRQREIAARAKLQKEKEKAMNGWDDDDDGGPENWDDDRARDYARVPRRPLTSRDTLYGHPKPAAGVPLWNGRPVAGMDSDHIMNAIMMCEKRFAEAIANFTVCHGAENPFYFANVFEMFPNYRNLIHEWERRKVS